MSTPSPEIVDAELVPHQVIVRDLPAEEFHRLQGIGLFEIYDLPNMQHSRAVVGEEVYPDGSHKIVAYWLVFDAVHVEPLWIHPDHRKKPGFARRLWKGVQDVLVATGVPIAFACIADNDAAENLPQALRLGFKKIPGSLFFIEVRPEDRTNYKSLADQAIEVMKAHQEKQGKPEKE
jgi:hypothetical protein